LTKVTRGITPRTKLGMISRHRRINPELLLECEFRNSQKKEEVWKFLENKLKIILLVIGELAAVMPSAFPPEPVRHARLQFSWSWDGRNWTDIGMVLDSTILSDEYGTTSCFTGSFFGLCCQDMSGTKINADFDYFEYCPFSV
jgi:hypothetical protein